MTKNPINILIIEDQPLQFKRLRERLVKTYGELANIYPNQDNETKTLYNFNYFIKVISEKKFDEIVTFYGDTDLFIIDNKIASIADCGADLRNFLFERNFRNGNFQVLFETSTPQNDLKLKDWDPHKEYYIFKEDGNVIGSIIEGINKLNDIDLATLNKGVKVDIYTFGEKLHFLWVLISKRTELFIDKLILNVFYLLIVIATLTGGFKICSTFLENVKTEHHNPGTNPGLGNKQHSLDSIKPNQQLISALNEVNNSNQIDPAEIEKEDIKVLQTAEHIFLYLLPIFIVFGFYNYYTGYTRRSLLSRKIGEIKEGTSTKTMRLTKVLFASSMISYVLIKVIEHLFSPDPQPIKLIGAGVLILILILYFWFLEHDNEKE